MNISEQIRALAGNHVPPYLYGSNFRPGKTLIPYSGMYWDTEEVEAAIDTFMNGDWVSAGEKVNEFERMFSVMFHNKRSFMVNSGSSANLVMIAALKEYYGWKDGDEIIVSPVGFPTTISTICQNGLKPVFVDIEWDTLNFDLCGIEKKVTSRTKAVFLSPVLGNPPNMDELMTICNRFNLKLILDNCDSLGTRWDGNYLNQFAVASSCSFYAAHHISTGEGGMISSDDEKLMHIVNSLSWWGRDCYCVGSNNLLKEGTCGKRFSKWLTPLYDGVVDHKYVFSHMGYNFKPLDLQGAIGIVQLGKFTEISSRRKRSKAIIERIVTSHIPEVVGVHHFAKSDVNWFGVPFICEGKELKQRLVQHFETYKIQTRNYFSGNILLHPGYSHLDDCKKYPEANKVLDKVFFLGSAPHYGDEVFDYIYGVIKSF
jgi:CDP-6-deoxy-D-xylo-4-hexulose-3-dehydrase